MYLIKINHIFVELKQVQFPVFFTFNKLQMDVTLVTFDLWPEVSKISRIFVEFNLKFLLFLTFNELPIGLKAVTFGRK